MMNICKYIFLYIICLIIPNSVSAYGLRFRGADYPIDKRTSYRVFENNFPTYSDYFDLQFDMALYPSIDIGYVVNIRDEKRNQAFNMFFDMRGDNAQFCLNQEGKNVLIALSVDKLEMTKNHWFKVKIAFNLKQDKITFRVHDKEKTYSGISLSDTLSPEIVFGRCGHIIDIPSIAINNLTVNGNKKYMFPFNETEGEYVHDSFGKSLGKVENPIWLINDAFCWTTEASFSSFSEAGSCYDSENNVIYYFNSDSIFTYLIETGNVEVRRTRGRCPMKLFLANSFVDRINEKIYVYEVFHEFPHENEPSIVSLDLKTLEWEIEGTQHFDMQLHHHDSYYNADDREYIIFGGFGNMHYSNKFWHMQLDSIDSSCASEWSEITTFSGEVICPRYFSSVGYSPESNSIYVFGGMGNETGDQIVGRCYFHDLYRVDLKDKQIHKLWELENEPNVVPARGMIVCGDSAFYVLRYRESISHSYLHLYNFSIKEGSYRVMGDSIPILSDKITTNAHLYYNELRNRLFVTVQESMDDISSKFTIYSLLFPPVTDSIYDKGNNIVNMSYVVVICSILFISICISISMYLIKRRRVRNNEEECHIQNIQEKLKSPDTTVKEKVSEIGACHANSVYLFGDFTVYDRKGRDISYMFSSRIKQVFFLIIYYNTSGGISSKELSDRLWPDKPKDKVKNSRGVALNQLRSLLNELDGIELIYEKVFFRLILSEPFYCDYLQCIKLLSNKLESNSRKEFLNIISRGKFVSFIENPLFDYLKENVECKLEVIVLEQMRKAFKNEDYIMTINFAKAEFNIDPINEEALNCCIKSYFHLKRENSAIAIYQQFMSEYLKGTGEEYNHSFSEFWC